MCRNGAVATVRHGCHYSANPAAPRVHDSAALSAGSLLQHGLRWLIAFALVLPCSWRWRISWAHSAQILLPPRLNAVKRAAYIVAMFVLAGSVDVVSICRVVPRRKPWYRTATPLSALAQFLPVRRMGRRADDGAVFGAALSMLVPAAFAALEDGKLPAPLSAQTTDRGSTALPVWPRAPPCSMSSAAVPGSMAEPGLRHCDRREHC